MFLCQFLHDWTSAPSTTVCMICVDRVNLGVKDLSDLELWFTIYLDQWQRRLYLVRYGVGYGRFELGDMEDGVDGAHGIWKVERKREGAYLCYDSIGTQILL